MELFSDICFYVFTGDTAKEAAKITSWWQYCDAFYSSRRDPHRIQRQQSLKEPCRFNSGVKLTLKKNPKINILADLKPVLKTISCSKYNSIIKDNTAVNKNRTAL